MMPSAESMAALSGAVPMGPAMPARPRTPVPTRHHVVSRSAPGTKLAPRIANVNPPPHIDRTRGKKVAQNGIATMRATQQGGGPSNY
jgi:hypothetical protein